MVNIYSKRTALRLRGLCLALAASLTLNALLATSAGAAPATRYKKNTVIDFEGALVEGKSRKPYSAYLTQQKESAFGELHQWQPDLGKSLRDAEGQLENSL